MEGGREEQQRGGGGGIMLMAEVCQQVHTAIQDTVDFIFLQMSVTVKCKCTLRSVQGTSKTVKCKCTLRSVQGTSKYMLLRVPAKLCANVALLKVKSTVGKHDTCHRV